jgi:P-type E1-E2 ATPase
MAENGIDVKPAAGADAGGEILVARGGRLLGSIIVADTIRSEAEGAIKALHRMGVRTVLLTGDSRRVADAVGSKLRIKEIEAELLPEEKLRRVQALVAQKRVVAMVGDGINDAPALAEANVGIAMGSGTDVAQESSDVVLLGNDLARLVETLALAKQTRGIIWQNFAGTLVVDTVGMGLAAIGLLGPVLAAFVHVTSELFFILNSARLLPGSRAS